MKKLLLIPVLALSIGISASAADSAKDAKMQEMMKKMKEYGTPGESHKVLSDLAGNWTFTIKHWETADAKPQESTGTSTMKMILGGRWLQQDAKSEMMGMPYEGFGLTGFDNLKKKYEAFWFDNMGTGAMHGEGTFDSKTKTLKETGTYSCPIVGKDTAYRTDWKIQDKDNFTYTMHGKGMNPKGKEFKQMEITYKRAK